VMRIFFVRHGESEANCLHEFSNRGLKHGLTDRGKEHARGLAASLRGVAATRLFSSPLLRAIQTAEILSGALEIPYEITDALREYDCGVLEGRSDAQSWEIYEAVEAAWLREGDWERKVEGGECFREIRERFVPFVEGYAGSGQSIVAVGHGGLYRCMLPLVLVNVDTDFAIEHPIGHTDCVVSELRADGLTCLRWGRMRLLEAGR
jgi:2,3-bisphosphoglycerate-dependent phosphoglycerate mutase